MSLIFVEVIHLNLLLHVASTILNYYGSLFSLGASFARQQHPQTAQ